MTDDIADSLPAQLRTVYQKSAQRLTPTLMNLRFGDTATLAKLTPEAERLAGIADQAQAAWRSIHDTHWHAQGDKTATEAGRLVRSATLAKQRMKMVAASYEAALTAAETTLGHLKRSIDKALTPPSNVGDAMLDSEARALIRAATDPAKAAAIARANPRAVATAPAALMGLADDLHRAIRSEYLDATLPDESAKYSDLLHAVRSAGDATEALNTEARSLIDFDTADKLEAHTKAATAS